MIYLVHGNDLAKSRQLILNQQAKLKVTNRLEWNISDTTPEQLTAATSTFSIFGEAPFVVLDVSGIGRLDISKHIEALSLAPTESTVIILSNSKLMKTHQIITALKPKTIEVEKRIEANIFSFLDALFSNNRTKTYKELQKLLNEENDPFYIFSMVLYQLRMVAYSVYSSPLEKPRFASYKRRYSQIQVKDLYNFFYDIDKRTKLGEIDPELMLTLVTEKMLNLG